MISKIETVQADAKLEDLLPIFRADHVPLVLDGDKFLGLITRIDLLNYLRRRMK
jgi:cystathionine beta-synthase